MEFQFESLQAFFWMKGHGPYVWACYGISLAAFVLLAVVPGQQRKQLFKLLRANKARQEAGGQNAGIRHPTAENKSE